MASWSAAGGLFVTRAAGGGLLVTRTAGGGGLLVTTASGDASVVTGVAGGEGALVDTGRAVDGRGALLVTGTVGGGGALVDGGGLVAGGAVDRGGLVAGGAVDCGAGEVVAGRGRGRGRGRYLVRSGRLNGGRIGNRDGLLPVSGAGAAPGSACTAAGPPRVKARLSSETEGGGGTAGRLDSVVVAEASASASRAGLGRTRRRGGGGRVALGALKTGSRLVDAGEAALVCSTVGLPTSFISVFSSSVEWRRLEHQRFYAWSRSSISSVCCHSAHSLCLSDVWFTCH